jgi:beta-alanine degradation protein BauB
MPMTEQIAATFDDAPNHWTEDALAELRANDRNGHVGMALLSETDRVRVWRIDLAPGERHRFHRHVLDYFWTALAPGRARSRYGDGAVRTFAYAAGETLHLHYAAGESMIHDLTNIGDTPLAFLTVEFLGSANPPLPL